MPRPRQCGPYRKLCPPTEHRMTVMPKSPPPWLNSRLSDVFIKWISRLNTWMYHRNNGQGLGGTFHKIPVALLTDHRPQDRSASRSVSADLHFYFDPVCPFAWMTSKWVRTVAAQRDYDVDWRFISLRIDQRRRRLRRAFPRRLRRGTHRRSSAAAGRRACARGARPRRGWSALLGDGTRLFDTPRRRPPIRIGPGRATRSGASAARRRAALRSGGGARRHDVWTT